MRGEARSEVFPFLRIPFCRHTSHFNRAGFRQLSLRYLKARKCYEASKLNQKLDGLCGRHLLQCHCLKRHFRILNWHDEGGVVWLGGAL